MYILLAIQVSQESSEPVLVTVVLVGRSVEWIKIYFVISVKFLQNRESESVRNES